MTTVYGHGVRQRPWKTPARERGPLPEPLQRMVAGAETALAEPFAGLTSDGAVLPGVFPLEATGVSTRPIKEAADAFLASLDADQRAAGAFPLESEEWRRWFNIHGNVMRHGLLLEALSPTQREASLDLLAASLSARGFGVVRDVMRLNETIGEITGSTVEYGEWVYFLSLFGSPSLDQPWGWQIDGHHLIINCFVLKDQVVMTPTFLGAEPVYADGGKYAGTRAFAAEEAQGLAVLRSLSDAQRAQAILYSSALYGDLPPERFHPTEGHIRAGAFKDNLVVSYEGVRADSFSPEQQRGLLDLVEVYVGQLRPGHAQVRMDEVERHLAETRFAWIGATDEQGVYYYRVHSPVILIEFDHQRGIAFDNDEPSRNHIHTVVRTPNGNDYGKDLLRQHYALAHSDAAPGR